MPISSSYGNHDHYSSKYSFAGSSNYSTQTRRPLPAGGNGPYDELGRKLRLDSFTSSSFKPRTASQLTGMGRVTPNKADYDRNIGSQYSGVNYPYATTSTSTSSSRYGAASPSSYSPPSRRTDSRTITTPSRYSPNTTSTLGRKASPTESPRTSLARQRSSSLFDLSGGSSSSSQSSTKRGTYENGYQATTSTTDRRRSSVVTDDVGRMSRSLARASVSDRRRSESTSGTLPRLGSKEDSFERVSSGSRRASLDRANSQGSDSSFAVSVMQCVEKFLPNFARPYRKLNVFKLPSNIISIKLPLQLKERERERNVLFNDALNTFYLRLYGIGSR